MGPVHGRRLIGVVRALARPAFALAFAVGACASDGGGGARDAAYQQCLKESMAIAMAWDAIEAMCAERTKPADPLGGR